MHVFSSQINNYNLQEYNKYNEQGPSKAFFKQIMSKQKKKKSKFLEKKKFFKW